MERKRAAPAAKAGASDADTMVEAVEAEEDTGTLSIEKPPSEPSFIKFYGLYWAKEVVEWDDSELLGQPKGWMGKGRTKPGYDYKAVQMNFWNQKGVYVLYDANLNPVYAGQAGLTRGKGGAGRSIGTRLAEHASGVYRNGWELFSWFGFLDTAKLELKKASNDARMSPKWEQPSVDPKTSFNLVLASFEAVLIEGFAPRFNSRGGDLRGAQLVNQFD